MSQTRSDAAPLASLPQEDTHVPADWGLLPTDPKDVPPDVGDVDSMTPEVADFLAQTAPFGRVRRVVNRSPGHLNDAHRRRARSLACDAMKLVLDHASAVHYTQTLARWQGINDHLVAAKGRFPTEGDCSSTATWAVWNGIAVPYHVHDVVNWERWRAGYTGTMILHGLHAGQPRQWMRGDCLIYGESANATEHTAVCVGWDPREKYHMVISHGSEAGPFYLRWNYRSDLVAVRRYI